MEQRPRITSLISLIIFIFANYYFVTFAIELNGYISILDDLKALLEDISYETMLNLIVVITTTLTTISLLVQYLIGKFLLMIFAPEVKSKLFYALIPKILIMFINVICMGILQINNLLLYMLTALIGSVLILLFFQYKKENWKASILFATPFIIDALISLGKEIFSIL
ncbi:membrane protein [Bacillus pumilus]|uniref:Yip1 domain-containing protein n=1 Tax=Bacillus altitudinis TaxID=293387 RepID=A0ABV1S095_BACAB|nr:hypothetical protein [Bacillus altitudinis]AMM90673.1 membrane protein [Bacillus pumilus]KDE31172.1 hypothetical protein BA79_09148 [Bacillus altitudinis 41KF2b]MCI9883184.1 hypothetical protein [Bacillus altitudinis]MCY7713103.1 hypothetical protein [Bacillus altitudinis]MDX2364618.1 hypothetical protein [Bacillus altitudinis]